VSVRLRALSRSNDPACDAAAAGELARGGSAIDAVLAGYFAAAGVYPGVLLGPVTLLLGGVGSGDRAFDGRVRQPGRNAKRPRGSLQGQTPPQAARVGVPCSVPALAVALGYGAQATLGRLVQPGVVLAQERGAQRRARVLSRVGEVGALALSEPELSFALVRCFGAPNGGTITPADFTATADLDQPAARLERDGQALLAAPWASAALSSLARGVAVCAIDVNGLLAALVLEAEPDGVPVEDLELVAPLLAVPTLRGVSRVAPGTPLPSAAPIWIELDASGTPASVWCAPNETQPGARGFGIRRGTGARTVEAVES
jgi:gamma-glutamyltranspeptidase/glutathione hydrolase